MRYVTHLLWQRSNDIKCFLDNHDYHPSQEYDRLLECSRCPKTLLGGVDVPFWYRRYGVEEPVYTCGKSYLVYTGGDGLFKPETELWLLPKGIKARHIYSAGIEAPGGRLPNGSHISYFTVGAYYGYVTNPYGPKYGDPSFYHGGRLKLRNVRLPPGGGRMTVVGNRGQLLAEMVVQDGKTRQEGHR